MIFFHQTFIVYDIFLLLFVDHLLSLKYFLQVLLDHEEIQVSLDLEVPLVLPVLLVLRDLQAQQVVLELLDQQVQLEVQDLQVQQVRLEVPVQLDHRVELDPLDHEDLWVLLDGLVFLEESELLDHRDKQVGLDHKDPWASQVLLDKEDHKDLQVGLGHKDGKDSLVGQGDKVLRDLQDGLDLKDQQVRGVMMGYLVNQVDQVLMALQEVQE